MKQFAVFFLIFASLLQVQAAGKIRLALNWKPEPQFGGFYSAQVNNLFKNEKLDVEILEGGSGTPTIQMLTAGKVEYAVVSADEVILSHDRGATDVVAIFAAFQTNPQGVMTHAAKNYASLEALLADDKATLLWQAGLPYAQYLKKTKTIKATTAPYLGGIGNFQKDESLAQQCFVTSEPLTAEAAGLKVKTFLVAESGYNPYTTVLVTRDSRAKAHPQEVLAMIKAVREGWNRYLQNPDSTNAHMQNLNRAMTIETFKKSAEAQKALIETSEAKGATLGRMTLARWQTLIDQLTDLKLIKKKLKPETLFANPEPKR